MLHTQADRRLLLITFAGGLLLTLLILFSRLTRGAVFAAYDWRVYFTAADDLAAGRSPYAALISGPTDPVYLYPPILAALLVPLLPIGLALSSAMAVAFTAVGAGWVLLREQLRAVHAPLTTPGSGLRARLAPALLGVALGTLAIWWLPAYSGAIEGNVSLLLGLLIAGGLVYAERAPGRAGLLLGLAIGIKMTPAILLPLLLVRGQWRTVAASLLAVVVLAMLSVLVPGGPLAWADFPASLGQAAGAAFAGYGDPSIDERVARGLASNAAPLAFLVRFGLLESGSAITLARVLPLLAIPLALLLDRWVGGGRRGAILALLLSLLVVPTLWPHASLLLLPLAAPLFSGFTLPIPGGRVVPAPWAGLALLLLPFYVAGLGTPLDAPMALGVLLFVTLRAQPERAHH